MTHSAHFVRFFSLLMLVIVSRALFFDQTLVGEEGSFAALVVDVPISSAVTSNGMPQMKIGSINGQPLYEPFQHNITPYLLIENVGSKIFHALSPATPSDPQILTRSVRATYFAFFLSGVVGFLLISAQTWIGTSIALFTLSAPLVVGASIQPQIDGSTGVLLIGIAGFLLIKGWKSKLPAMGLAGIAIGLGRHELTMAFGAAVVITWGLMFFYKLRSLKEIAPFAAGLAVGTLTSYAISPTDYVAGFGTMTRVYNMPTSPLAIILAQWRQVWPIWTLMTVANLVVVWNLRSLLEQRPEVVTLVFGGSAVVLGFAISGWSGDGLPRYYVPAAIALSIALVGLREQMAALPHSFAAIAVVAMIATTGINAVKLYHSRVDGTSITSLPGAPLARIREDFVEAAEKARFCNTITLQQASIWIYYPDVDFISVDMGDKGARNYLQNKFPSEVDRLERD